MQSSKFFILFISILCFLFASVIIAQEEQYKLKQITDSPTQDGFPAWSPDGKQFVFSRYGRDFAPEKTGLWLYSLEKGEFKQLQNVIGEHPDWSPDGKYIVFDGDYGNSIQLVAASGGIPVRIDPDSITIFRGGQPKWSPDGSSIAFKEDSILWVMNVSSRKCTKVYSEYGKIAIPACWSIDGKEIYLYLRNKEDHNATICAINLENGTKRLLRPTEDIYRYSALSADGSLLAFVLCEERDCNLWITRPDGVKAIQITTHPAYEDGPSWSPDGRKIAFVSRRSEGNFDIWMLELDPLEILKQLK